MSDYSKTYNGAAKDAAESVISGADFDTEFDAISTAITSKANKKVPAAIGNVAGLSSTGDLTDTGVTSTELGILDGATVTTAELNTLDGITATVSELNTLDGITATVDELNILDGATLTTTELNYVDGVTSSIQTQLDAKIDSPVDTADIADDSITSDKLNTGAFGSTISYNVSEGTSQVVPEGIFALGWTISGSGTPAIQINTGSSWTTSDLGPVVVSDGTNIRLLNSSEYISTVTFKLRKAIQ